MAEMMMSEGKAKLDDLRIDRPAEAGGGRGVWLLAAGLLLLVASAAGVWWAKKPKHILVETALVQGLISGSGHNRTVLNASGYVTARRAATVSSKVTGKVVEVLVEEGLRVEKDQVLAVLDSTNVKTGLDLALARKAAAGKALEETRVRIREAERELRRQQDLLRQQISRQADFDSAESESLALQARLRLQEAEVLVADKEVASWQQQLEDTTIRAPFAGIVTSKNAQPGEMISPVSAGGGFTRTGICTIVDMESLEIEIDVNESFINRVEANQSVEATLDAYPEWKIPCRVIAIIPTADRQKSTVKVRVGFDSLDARILPQMGVKVAFRESATTGGKAGKDFRVPAAAVQKVNGREIVFVVRENRAERRAVALGDLVDGQWLVKAGLVDGDRVVVNWPASLKDGSLVRAKH